MKKIKNHVLSFIDNNDLSKSIGSMIREQFKSAEFYSVNTIDDFISMISNNQKIRLILLDNDASSYNAFEIMRRAKSINPKSGIMILTREISKELSLKALNSGAFNLLPLDNLEENLIMSLRTYFIGIENDTLNEEITQFIVGQDITYKIPNSLRYIPVITHHLTRDLVQLNLIREDDIEGVKLGIQEMIINAIEHGNLEISFDKKSELLRDGYDLFEIIEEYSKDERIKKKFVTINFKIGHKRAEYRITDEGNGFNWKSVIDNIYDMTSKENIFIEHGRGIIMAKKYFNEFYYNDTGNEVTLVISK